MFVSDYVTMGKIANRENTTSYSAASDAGGWSKDKWLQLAHATPTVL
jgi:hypothetical protein